VKISNLIIKRQLATLQKSFNSSQKLFSFIDSNACVMNREPINFGEALVFTLKHW